MTILVILGAIMVAAGIFGLGYCIVTGYAIRRDKPGPEVARALLNRLLVVNLGSVSLAALGLAVLVVGLIL